MKYYCRTTHDYNNTLREWEYRNLEIWSKDHIILDAINKAHPNTLGIHSFERDWQPLYTIVDNIYNSLLQDYIQEGGIEEEFKKNVSIEKIESELKSLIECYKKYDMVKERGT
jgi:hypothetical protein